MSGSRATTPATTPATGHDFAATTGAAAPTLQPRRTPRVECRWRPRILAFAALVVLTLAPGAGDAADRLFRIGTGGERGTYYPIGTRIAQALTAFDGPCDDPAPCGIPGLLAAAQLSNGSVANVESLTAGVLEAALVQADVAEAAYAGSGPFAGFPAHGGLREIASLYLETIHLVVSPRSELHAVSDLRGRRVSLDEPGSGTLVTARLVLAAFGLDEHDLRPFYLKPRFAGEKLLVGDLDAFFIVAGAPTPSVADLVARGGAALVPIRGPDVDRLLAQNATLSAGSIPAGTYPGLPATETVAVAARLLVRADLPEQLVFEVTRSLFSDRARRLLAEARITGAGIRAPSRPVGTGLPLHPGAARYYRLAPPAGKTANP